MRPSFADYTRRVGSGKSGRAGARGGHGRGHVEGRGGIARFEQRAEHARVQPGSAHICFHPVLSRGLEAASEQAAGAKNLLHFLQNGRVINRRRHRPGLAVEHLAHRPTQDLSGPSLR